MMAFGLEPLDLGCSTTLPLLLVNILSLFYHHFLSPSALVLVGQKPMIIE
jgi:hypothetical protein